MNAADLRKTYLGFFRERGHELMPSSSLVPNDLTLLFTSAGMVQFKDIFWGHVEPRFPRATTCQKCLRTTDIENVGRTAFHNTFFEMLGNFSFGDYFKEGAIRLAWEFLVDELGLPKERLSVSVYRDDDEAFALWRDVIGLPEDRITRLGKEHNWWGPVGDSGPCGPDSEIFYDTGADNACGPDCAGVACDCNRFSEIWNLVLIEFDARDDGSLAPLKQTGIDTGMGLERTTAVLQGAPTVFDIDVFRPIVESVSAAVSRPLTDDDRVYRNMIADHVRGVIFLLADGVMPGNEKQGYVSRRILRRAIRAGEKLDVRSGTLVTLVDPVIESLGDVYPEIVAVGDLARRLIGREEETFRRTLREGERRLEKLLDELTSADDRILPGELAFELMDTYGFPLEMTQEIAAESRVDIDLVGFKRALEAQRKRSRKEITGSVSVTATIQMRVIKPTEFLGYDGTKARSVVEDILPRDQDVIEQLVFPESPFYAESGGQVGDVGEIRNLDQPGMATVTDVKKNPSGVFLHTVRVVEGVFEIGDQCELEVDQARRARIQRNHTATHLLHAALREVLGSYVKQAGSEVNEVELRFDFSHFEKMSPDEIAQAEDLANAAVLADHEVKVSQVSLEEAQQLGAIGLFEDEYRGKERVRVIHVGDVSTELCGGTHVSRSGEIGLIKVVSEESIASGVRRIRAITGDGVLGHLREQEALLLELRDEIGEDPLEGIHRLKDELRSTQKRLDLLAAARVKDAALELIEEAEEVGGARLIAGRVDLPGEQLKSLADVLEERARPVVIVLVGDASGSGIALCKTSTSVDAVNAGGMVSAMAEILGGGGGGSKTFAQGGGPQVDKLDEALAVGREAIREALL